ncbi:hypothetical protein M1N24_00315 [Dehalococcoidia bacterium]|nr:hypothetical protein [Dehalococcoidia bacterium]
MSNNQSRQVTKEELLLLARIFGVVIATDRLERLAEQVSTVLEGNSQLDPAELQDIEPALTFCLPWEHKQI